MFTPTVHDYYISHVPRNRLGVSSARVSKGMTVPPTPIPTPNLKSTKAGKLGAKELARLQIAVMVEESRKVGFRPHSSPNGPKTKVPDKDGK